MIINTEDLRTALESIKDDVITSFKALTGKEFIDEIPKFNRWMRRYRKRIQKIKGVEKLAEEYLS